MGKKIHISIVIPSYNRIDDLRHCLNSIRNQNNNEFEVIVVDDGSVDETNKIVKEEFPEARLLINEINCGPSYSRNVGIMEAKGKYTFFLDSDTILSRPNLLNNFIQFFNKHPDAGTVGGEIRVNDNPHVVNGRMISLNGDSRSLSIRHKEGTFAECDFLATCCCMVKKDIAIGIGGFDPYYGFGGEDKDFGYRIKMAGYKNFVSSECAVEHRPSLVGRRFDETFRYYKTRIRFAIKNYSTPKVFISCILWLWEIFIFHILLPFKLTYFLLIRKKLVKENVIGGYMMIKALYENIISLREIMSARSKNFLKPNEINQYLEDQKRVHKNAIVG
jgi:GT2 family glycosyltransferase